MMKQVTEKGQRRKLQVVPSSLYLELGNTVIRQQVWSRVAAKEASRCSRRPCGAKAGFLLDYRMGGKEQMLGSRLMLKVG